MTPYREDARRPCPRCGTGLDEREQEGAPLWLCRACAGVWLPPESMNRVSSAREAPTSLREAVPVRAIKRETEVRYLRCPSCGAMMNRRIFARVSGIIVDVCREHGVWFDAGELAAVIAFVEGGGLDRARRREAEEREEARRAAHVERVVQQLPTHLERASDSDDTLRSIRRLLAELLE